MNKQRIVWNKKKVNCTWWHINILFERQIYQGQEHVNIGCTILSHVTVGVLLHLSSKKCLMTDNLHYHTSFIKSISFIKLSYDHVSFSIRKNNSKQVLWTLHNITGLRMKRKLSMWISFWLSAAPLQILTIRGLDYTNFLL